MNTVSNSLRLRSRSCLRTAALARQSARSNGEPPPPLEESALEYRPSVAGSIPAHKAVSALAASLLGLVGTLGHKAPPMANTRPTKRRPALDGAQRNYTSPQVGGQTEAGQSEAGGYLETSQKMPEKECPGISKEISILLR